MITRREFLRAGTVAGVFSAIPGGAVSANTSTSTVAFDAICDTRIDEGNQFLSQINQHAYRVHGMEADPGSVMAMIEAAATESRPIVGLTNDDALLIAEQIASSHGYTLTYKGIHSHTGADQIEHRLLISEIWQSDIELPLQQAQNNWPEVIAKIIPELITQKRPATEQSITAKANRANSSPGHLVSWILQPA